MTTTYSSRAPLDGVRVFDLTKNVAGPYATLILADLGADVIKVEDPVRGDETRYFSPVLEDGIAATYASLNRGKRSVAVDLKAGGQSRSDVEALIASSDVFIENLRPGAVEALGLGFERVAEINPRIVYCSISAFSDQGEHAGAPGYDAMMQAYTGLMDLTGEASGPPSRIGTGVLDMGAGMWAAIRLLAALHGDPAERVRATHIKLSLVETAAAFVIHHLAASRLAGVNARRLGTAQHNTAPYEAIRAQDGSVMVAAASQKLFERLCHAIDNASLISDKRFLTNDDRVANRHELVAEIEQTTTAHKVEDVVRTLEAAGVPVSPIRTLREFAEDPELVSLDWWREVEGQEWALPGLPLDRPKQGTTYRVPALGEHTEEVLRSVRR
ncbi:CoA transferase [Streptomyces plumbiresistens]|uniref:CoA transferase n=1 Tax=Streptomyces plumbiresistens TaxID=511811 RepID=A0ABP7SKM9_9ACTN